MATKRELLIVMKGAPDDLLRALDRAKSGFANLGKTLQNAGKAMTLGLTVPIAGVGLSIAKMAGDFEASMQKVAAISGATGDDFQRLRDLAKDLGATTKFSASQAADGMTFLAMAGFNTNQIIAAMPGLLDLAAAGQLELAEAADITSNILTAFGEGADQAGRAADLLATVAARTNTNVQQVGAAMSFAAPIAKSFGLTMEEAAGFIGVFSDAGVQADRAGVALRAAIVALADPSAKAAAALERLGVETKMANGEMRPFGDIIKDLAKSGMSAQDAIALFGGKMASAGLIAADSVPKLGALAEEFSNMDGNAKKMADTMNKGLKGGFVQLQSAIEGLAIEIGDSGLLEFLTELVAKATEMVRELAKTNPELLKWGTLLAAAAAAIGPLLWAVGGVATGISSLAAVLGGTSAAVKGFMGAIRGAPAILTGISTAVTGLPATLSGLGTAAAGALAPIGGLAGALTALKFAVAGVVAAFAGWQLGKWLADNVPAISQLGDAMAGLVLKIPGLEARLTGLNAAQADLEKQTRGLAKALADKGVVIEQGNKTIAAWHAALMEAARGYTATRDAAASADPELAKYQTSTAGIASALQAATGAASGAASGVQDFGSAAAAAGANVDNAVAPIERFKLAATSAIGPDAVAKIQAWRDEWAQVVDAAAGSLPTWAQLKAATDALIGTFPAISAELQDFVQSLAPVSVEMDKNAVASFEWEQRLRDAGITSQAVADGALTTLRQKLDLATEGFNNGTVSAEELKKVQGEYNDALGVTNDTLPVTQALIGAVDSAMDSLAQGITDAILGAGSLGDAFVGAMKQIAASILDIVVKGAMDVLLESIKGNIAEVQKLGQAFTNFFGLFSGGGSKKTPGAPGGDGGGIPGAGGGVDGIIGTIGVITQIAQLLVDIFQAFQLARMEKDIGRIEVTTREMFASLEAQRSDHWARHDDIMAKWDIAIGSLGNLETIMRDGLKLNISGGSVNLSLAFPPELKQALVDMVAELKSANSWLEKIKDWTEYNGLFQALATDYLRDIKDKIGAIAGTPIQAQAPISINTLNVSAPEGTNPRRFAEQLMRGLEEAGGMRSGSMPALVAG